MSASIDSPGRARHTIPGIQRGEIVKVTRHQHDQHNWQHPFERRRASCLPENFVLERRAPLVDAVIDSEFGETAARQD